MIPIVNDEFRYILFYSAKVGSSLLRELFVALHISDVAESNDVQKYHDLNQEYCLKPGVDYTEYYSFLITRNPYSRIVSAYLDQHVYNGKGLSRSDSPEVLPINDRLNFASFLESLLSISDEDRDSHFQTQSFSHGAAESIGLINNRPSYVGDIAGIQEHLVHVYTQIFSENKVKLRELKKYLSVPSSRNALYYSDQSYRYAADIPASRLYEMVAAPKAQDFLNSAKIRNLVKKIYRKDFDQYQYQDEDIPQVKASNFLSELPNNFDWRLYLELNPDLGLAGFNTERELIRHYLEFGRYETIPRALTVEAPDGFQWRRYLELNPDLVTAQITNERLAIIHYLGYGVREGRLY